MSAKLENLKKCLRDYEGLSVSDISIIVFETSHGKMGIGNSDAKEVLLEAAKTELRRQIEMES